MKAKVKDGQVLVCPYTEATLQEENPSTRFDSGTLETLFAKTEQAAMGAVLMDVVQLDKPVYNPMTHQLVMGAPTVVGQHVERGWLIIPLTSQDATSVLAAARLEVEEKIKAFRDNRLINGGFPVTVNGVQKWVHSDVFSRTQWPMIVRRADHVLATGGDMDAIMPKLDGSGPLAWKLKGSTGVPQYLPMTANLALQIATNGTIQDEKTFSYGEYLIAMMKAQANPLTFVYTQGWPKIFGE